MITKTKKPHECKGCCGLNCGCSISNTFTDSNQITHQCECKICLVKGVCQTHCDKFTAYIEEYFNYIRNVPKEFMELYGNIHTPKADYDVLTHARGIPVSVRYNKQSDKTTVHSVDMRREKVYSKGCTS